MPTQLRIHIPDRAVSMRTVADGAALVLGRADECDVVVAHDSVSRRHAKLSQDAAGAWQVDDLGSKNGVRLEGERVEHANVGASGWFAIGDVFCELDRVDAAAIAASEQRATERRAASQGWAGRVSRTLGTDALFANVLSAIVELADCRRGFLLTVSTMGALRVRAFHAIDPAEIASVDFSGSRGVVERAVRERRAIFMSSAHDREWLAGRASAVARGIRVAVALPLLHDGHLIGVAYADTDDDAIVLTELDAELLSAFAARAATAMAASNLDATLAAMERQIAASGRVAAAPDWDEIARAAPNELRP